jgi:hypothetical protein
MIKIDERHAYEKRESIISWWKERDKGGVVIIV